MITYDDYVRSKTLAEEARICFNHICYEYLLGCVMQKKMTGTVKHKVSGKLGVLKVEENPYGSIIPYTVNFHPFTKVGVPSLNSRNNGFYFDCDRKRERILEKLDEYFEVVEE